MANRQGNDRVQKIQEGKRRRRTEIEDTFSSNHKQTHDEERKSHDDNVQSSSKNEKVVLNEDMDTSERLKQLRTTILTKKIETPIHYVAEMVSLFNNRSEVPTNPCFIPSSSNAHNPQVPPPPVIIPKVSRRKIWMPLLFKPPPDMELSETEAELAMYIFMNSHVLDGKEILVLSLDGLALGDRKTLRTILPTSNISNQFMMMELALNNKKSVVELSKDYKDSFMGYVDLIKKIFVPVNDNDMHWYLVVFDLEEENCWLLDSNPFPDRNRWRRLHVKKLAIIIEEMLMDRSFYELSSYECPAISDFTLIEPEGLSQNLTSYHDCGVQVARWMTECISHDNYQSIEVNAESRMRLALDLVLDMHNQLRNETVRKTHMNHDCGVQVARWMTECISHDNYQSIGVNAESRMRLALDLVLDMHNQLRNETVRKAHMKFKVFTDGWDNSADI
ncbi:Ulp1 protease family, C-terminal catalytic domain [Sesbania bispinosa]|nr:Ulp1 protease family, C-terminal catalytic domain [Sesbania bispinosa]